MILQSWKERATIGRNRGRWVVALLAFGIAAVSVAVFLTTRLKWK